MSRRRILEHGATNWRGSLRSIRFRIIQWEPSREEVAVATSWAEACELAEALAILSGTTFAAEEICDLAGGPAPMSTRAHRIFGLSPFVRRAAYSAPERLPQEALR